MGCLDADTVVLYLARQLAAGPRDVVERHLDACAECRRLVAALVKDVVPDAGGETQIEIGRYRVDGELGRGSMGIVFAAHDPELRREVAIKLLRPGSAVDDAGRRLRREAEAMAAVSHPNVVSVFDVGTTDDGDVFVAMERIEGSTLRKWLAERSRTQPEIVAAFEQAGRGLEAAHRAGLVHRDFKPDNVLVDRDSGRVVVTDFGLARIERESSATPVPNASDVVTVTGALVGTPAYMAPEQLDGARGDARSDQFSFCVALFEALHGERPFTGHTVEALKEAIARGEIPDRGGPRRIRRALQRGLKRDPDARFPDMGRLLASLARPRRRWSAIVGGVMLAVVTGGLAWSTSAGNACGEEDSGWSRERAEAIRRALSGRSAYDTEAAERTIASLEHFDDAWTTTLATTCETDVAADDARMRCLADARRRFTAVLEVVAEPGAVNGEGAITASTRLPDPEDCLDSRRGSAPEVDNDAAETLAQAIALGHAGRLEDGIDLAREAAERGASVGDSTTRVEALVVLGHLETLSGDPAAEQDLEAAYALASEHGDDHNAVEAALELAFVVGVERQAIERGLAWARHAESALARIEAGPALEARLHHTLGHLRSVGGDEAAALPEFLAATAALEDAGEQDDPRYGSYLCSVAESLHKLGRFDEARAKFEAALVQLEERVGDGHIMLTSCQLDYGTALEIDQDLDAAESVLERALQGVLSSRPRDDPGIARYLEGMAGLRLNQRRSAEAADLYREVLEIDERAKGPSHPVVATDWSNLAAALDEVGRHDEARAAVERALVITREALGDEHPRVGRLLMLLGIFARRAGDLDTARARLEEAVAALAIAPGREHPLYDVAREELGVVLIETDPEAALALLQEVMASLTANSGASHPNVAHTHARISEALLALGRRDEALSHLIVARDILTPVLGPTHPHVVEMHTRVDALQADR